MKKSLGFIVILLGMTAFSQLIGIGCGRNNLPSPPSNTIVRAMAPNSICTAQISHPTVPCDCFINPDCDACGIQSNLRPTCTALLSITPTPTTASTPPNTPTPIPTNPTNLPTQPTASMTISETPTTTMPTGTPTITLTITLSPTDTVPPTDTPSFTPIPTDTLIPTDTPTIPPTPNATVCAQCDIDFQESENEITQDIANEIATGYEFCQTTCLGVLQCIEICDTADEVLATLKESAELLAAVVTHNFCLVNNNCT